MNIECRSYQNNTLFWVAGVESGSICDAQIDITYYADEFIYFTEDEFIEHIEPYIYEFASQLDCCKNKNALVLEFIDKAVDVVVSTLDHLANDYIDTKKIAVKLKEQYV